MVSRKPGCWWSSKLWRIKVEFEGKIVFSEEAIFTRVEEDNGLAKPAPDAAEIVIPGTK